MITTQLTSTITIQESKTYNFLALNITDANLNNALYTNQAGIYTLIFEDDRVNKVYIGETNNFSRRLNQHLTSTLKNKVIKKIYFFTTYNNYLDKSLLFNIETQLITRFNQVKMVELVNDKQLDTEENNDNLTIMYTDLIYNYLMDKNITLINAVEWCDKETIINEECDSIVKLKYLFELQNKHYNSDIRFSIDEELMLFSGTTIELDISKRLKVCEWLKDIEYDIFATLNYNKFLLMLQQDVVVDENEYDILMEILPKC